MIAIVLAAFLFFANPGISEAATAGRITGPAGKCLDNEDNKLVNKNPVVLWTCDGTKAQKWTFSSTGAVVNPNSGLCLDANKTTNGTRLWMWTCNKTAAQKWVVPKTAPAPQPTTPAPAPTPSTMPIGDMPGWKHIFAEGAFAAANGSVLPAAYKDKFWTYPDGWGDTLKNGKYMPSQTMSVKDGLFRVRMRNEGGVNKVGALLPKLVNKKDTGGDNMGQLYGRYSIRFKTDTTRGYKIAWLLWPDSTGGIQHSPAGEIDFPEGELDGNILGFVHPTEVHGYNGGQFSYDTKQSFGTG